MSHLLVTNDYPPKFGGIQNYLFDLWRRLPPTEFAVLTHEDPAAAAFDASAGHRIVRVPGAMLLPTGALAARIDAEARTLDARLIVLDPMLPLGLIGTRLRRPYAVVVHGAEVTVPARLSGLRALARRALAGAALIVAAGSYPEEEVRRLLGRATPPIAQVPPGVDSARFHPLGPDERVATRARIGVADDALLVVSVSRLVPRKGMDVLIEAAAQLASEYPALAVRIAGSGRDVPRLRRLVARTGAPVRLLGRVDEDALPALMGAADIGVMLCRSRWLGLEQEGFGMVFLEGAATGVAQIAGGSGGAAEAVVHEQTGLVVDRPADVVPATAALRRLLGDEALRARLGAAGRDRAVASFDPDLLARRLREALVAAGG